jgi:hypothetical protein
VVAPMSCEILISNARAVRQVSAHLDLATFQIWEEYVLLALAKTVDLIHEENQIRTGSLPAPLSHRALTKVRYHLLLREYRFAFGGLNRVFDV